jgi:hypothetical protein
MLYRMLWKATRHPVPNEVEFVFVLARCGNSSAFSRNGGMPQQLGRNYFVRHGTNVAQQQALSMAEFTTTRKRRRRNNYLRKRRPDPRSTKASNTKRRPDRQGVFGTAGVRSSLIASFEPASSIVRCVVKGVLRCRCNDPDDQPNRLSMYRLQLAIICSRSRPSMISTPRLSKAAKYAASDVTFAVQFAPAKNGSSQDI